MEAEISAAVDAIIDDLSYRRGLKQEWEQIDDDVKEEIRQTWIDIIRDKLNSKE